MYESSARRKQQQQMLGQHVFAFALVYLRKYLQI